MFTMPSSITQNMTLIEVIDSLKQNERVVGLIVAGSSANDSIKPENDYDLVVVLRDYPYPMHVALTTIDGRMSDIAFWSLPQLEQMLTRTTLQANQAESVVFHWVKTGIIRYDPTGLLQKVRDYEPEFFISDNDQRTAFNLWYKINFNLYHGKRMLTSNDDVYLMATDFRFLYMLLEVLDAYMLNYKIPQRGEKATIRYLKQHAPEHLAQYMKALHATDRHDKFKHYQQFAEIALEPVGGLWESEAVTAFNLHHDMPLDDYDKLMIFWQKLFD